MSKLKCAVSTKYTPDFKDLEWKKKVKYLIKPDKIAYMLKW